MTQDQKKRAVAQAAVEHVEDGMLLGVGTGSTTDLFVDALVRSGKRIAGGVASSERTAERLRSRGVRVLDLNETGDLALYVDGADEATPQGLLIKGGGGALTREKIVAAASRTFICIVDDSKIVRRLGAFPLPVEVIPMARALVSRHAASWGARPVLREGFTTDNGNCILDLHGLSIEDGVELEDRLNAVAGVVACGLFCRRPADLILAGTENGTRTYP